MTCKPKDNLTAEELRSLYSYDPETGLFWSLKYNRTVGYVDSRGYVVVEPKGIQFRAHRLAWLYMTGEWPANQIDHINGVRNDNRWSNLRAATNAENGQNQKIRSDNRSGYTGVRWHSVNRKWQVSIKANGRRHFWYFDDQQSAIEARLKAEADMFTHAPARIAPVAINHEARNG